MKPKYTRFVKGLESAGLDNAVIVPVDRFDEVFTPRKLRVLEALMEEPGFQSMREVADYIGSDAGDVRKDLRFFEDEGFIRFEEVEKYGSPSLKPVLEVDAVVPEPFLRSI